MSKMARGMQTLAAYAEEKPVIPNLYSILANVVGVLSMSTRTA
jgi:hypothetical protein